MERGILVEGDREMINGKHGTRETSMGKNRVTGDLGEVSE